MKKKTRAKSSSGTDADAGSSQNSSSPRFPEVSQVATTTAADAVNAGDLVNAAESDIAAESTAARWTFLTNHSHVLILISRNPDAILRQVAIRVGITERAVQRIIADLEDAGILQREKVGRQNHYRIITVKPLRHSVESHRTIGDLLSLMEVNVE